MFTSVGTRDATRAPAKPEPSFSNGEFEHQQLLMAMTDELLSQRALSDKTWHAARQTLTERGVIEMCLLVGHYQGLATTIGGLGIQIEDGA